MPPRYYVGYETLAAKQGDPSPAKYRTHAIAISTGYTACCAAFSSDDEIDTLRERTATEIARVLNCEECRKQLA